MGITNLLAVVCFNLLTVSCGKEDFEDTALLMDTIYVYSGTSEIDSISTTTDSADSKSDSTILEMDTIVSNKDTMASTSDQYMPVAAYNVTQMDILQIGRYSNRTGHSIQAAVLIGDTIYQFHDGGYMTLSALENYTEKSDAIYMGFSAHCNSLDAYITRNGDTLLYSDNGNLYKIVERTNLQKEKKVSYSGFAGYCHDPAVDWPNQNICFLDYSKNSWKDSTNNHMILNKFSFDGDYMDNPRLEKQMHMSIFLPAFQDGYAMNGKAYYAFGLSNTDKGIAVFDVRTDDWSCNVYYLNSILQGEEPEGIFYRDGYMYMTCVSGRLYKMLWDENAMANRAALLIPTEE